jgi:hypothetical protein
VASRNDNTEILGSFKGGEFLGKLKDSQLINSSSPWS